MAWLTDLSSLPFFDLPTSDSLFYARQAARIASGEILGDELSYPSSPLYPYLIAPAFLLGGRLTFWAIYIAQASLDAGHAVILRRLGRSLFGEAAGWFAGIAWAGYGLAVFYTGDLMEGSIAAFSASASLLLLLGRARRAGPVPAQVKLSEAAVGGSFRLAAGGSLLAVAALLRPHFLPVLPLAAAGVAWLRPRGVRWPAMAAFLAGAVLPLGASLARNTVISGEPIVISPYSGLNAYLGNHRGAGGYLDFPAGKGLRNDLDLRDAAHAFPEASAGRRMSETEISAFWWREAFREMAADPAAWIGLLFRKVRLFWSSLEAPNHLDFYFFRESSAFLSAAAVPFGLIAPLALVGILLVASGPLRGPPALLLCVLIAAYAASVSLFFIADRFRLPITGWILLPAGGALAFVLAGARERPRAAAAAAVLTALLAFALHLPDRGPHGAREHVMVAASLAGRGRLDEAERLLRRAVAIDPGSGAARFNLGGLLVRSGRGDEAEVELREATRLAPGFAAAHAALGELLTRSGAPSAESLEEFRRALELEPYGETAEAIRRRLAARSP